MTRCAKAGCENPGVWSPVMVLWARGHDRASHQPARGHIFPKDPDTGEAFLVCHACKEATTFLDLVPRDAWPMIVRSFVRIGRAEPDMETGTLEWTAMN